jgi:hypothetical protein
MPKVNINHIDLNSEEPQNPKEKFKQKKKNDVKKDDKGKNPKSK